MLYVLTNLSEVEPYMQEFNEQFWHESREPTLEEASALLRDGVGNDMPDFISWFKQKGTTDESMSADLRQVADGCAYRVRSFKAYDVNGYRFHTASHEQSRPNRRTTNTGVFTPGLDGAEYYRRIEEIYELNFDGSKPLNPVIFKCHWFDPEVTVFEITLMQHHVALPPGSMEKISYIAPVESGEFVEEEEEEEPRVQDFE
ncbi:uncharacterized protein LOC133901518 [Phragmites australis]|uniref:uncharacterized protein LOC133901518 n=1 Tax=Phragmites australis TaxID=29695 RepID=UPI002D77A87C|nr:uncharacterized protein LOC133901518 [Phragmites australis]